MTYLSQVLALGAMGSLAHSLQGAGQGGAAHGGEQQGQGQAGDAGMHGEEEEEGGNARDQLHELWQMCMVHVEADGFTW